MRGPRSGANEIGAQGDVHQQVRLLRHVDVEDFEIRAAVARTREHHLEGGGVTGNFTNALPTSSTHGRERSTNSVHDKGSSLRGPSLPPMKYLQQ
jgi:hypothetical protein